MAKIYIDKYGNETTEGPQEGVIGAATGTHSTAGLTSYTAPGGAATGGLELSQQQAQAAKQAAVPGQGPGHWETQGFNLDPFSGHFNVDPTHAERNWVADAPTALPAVQTVQALKAQQEKLALQQQAQMAQNQANGVRQYAMSVPHQPPPGPPMASGPRQMALNSLPVLGQAPAPVKPQMPFPWASWMAPWQTQRLGG